MAETEDPTTATYHEDMVHVHEHKHGDLNPNGASKDMDMDMVRRELKAYDGYNVSPLAIDRTDPDKLAADYKNLVEAGSIVGEGSTPEEAAKKQEEFDKEHTGGPVNESPESAPEPEPEVTPASSKSSKTSSKSS